MVSIPQPTANSPPRPTLYYGTIVHSLSLTNLEISPNTLLYVSEHGIIEWIERGVQGEMIQEVASSKGVVIGDGVVQVVELGDGEFLCPGLIDTHTHAPQFPNCGTGQQYQLLEWLEKLTFPREAMFKDVEYARKVYHEVVRRTLNAGTTTSCYYASLHTEATKALADICLERGQRAFIGKPCMDQNCPSTYTETPSESQSSTAEIVAYCDKLSHSSFATSGTSTNLPPLIQPILTPRFAISTTPETLTFLGNLSTSKTPSIAIQTHLSENLKEVEFVKSMYPDCETYAGVYEKFGLLGPGTILAHCVHLDDDEREVIARNGAGVSHCPISNTNLNSGAAEVQKMLDKGIKVGLGTDCSGGFALGIISALRGASSVSKYLSFSNPTPSEKSSSSLSIPQLFHMATLGGASLCRLDEMIGNFLPGKEFDAIRISPKSPGMWVEKGEAISSIFEKWLLCGDDRDMADVWVRGRRVGGSSL